MKRLKQLRKLHNLTAKQLAEKLRLAESTISLYENGKREPDFKTLLTIARFFNVSTDYLLENDNNPPTSSIPTPLKEGLISIRSRDGSTMESELNDDQVEIVKRMIEQFNHGKENK